MNSSRVIVSLVIIILGVGTFAYWQYGQPASQPSAQSSTNSNTQTSIQSTTQSGSQTSPGTLVLAVGTSLVDSGLLENQLIPAFQGQYNVQVQVLSLGTGQAIATAQRGDADAVFVHSHNLEVAFVDSEYGVHRVGIMFDDFIIIGPVSDPAGIKGMTSATKAFLKIYQAAQTGPGNGVIFVSRADKSGTNVAELNFWAKDHLAPQNNTYPWYIEAGAGQGTVLHMCDNLKAYALTDRGTWLSHQDQLTNLKILVQGDKALLNPYGFIPVSHDKWPQRNYPMAVAFAKFLISPQGQGLIENYTKHDQSLFHPIALNITEAMAFGFPNQQQELAWYQSINPSNMNLTQTVGIIIDANQPETKINQSTP